MLDAHAWEFQFRLYQFETLRFDGDSESGGERTSLLEKFMLASILASSSFVCGPCGSPWGKKTEKEFHLIRHANSPET